MVTAAKEHLKRSFPERAKAHIRCHLERCIWDLRAMDGFSTFLTYASNAIYVAASLDEDSHADEKIEDFLIRRGEDIPPQSVDAVFDHMDLYRHDFSGMRGATPPPKKQPTRAPAKFSAKRFAYHSKIPANTLPLLSRYREEDEAFIARRQDIWTGINTDQPALRSAKTKEKVRESARSFTEHLPPPSWIDEDGPLNTAESREYGSLVWKAQALRQQMWVDRCEPGCENPPKRFTLLPVSPLSPAFISIDADVIAWLGAQMDGQFTASRKDRLPWRNIFAFYTKRVVEGPAKQPKSTRGKRGVLRTNRRKVLRGIPLLYDHAWLMDDDHFKEKRRNPSTPVPFVVNNIKSDGVRVHTTLVTLGAEGAPGRDQLVKKGYDNITETFVAGEHTRGIFKDAAPLSDALIADLNREDSTCFIEAVGVDAGGRKVINSASARVTSTTDHQSFKGSTVHTTSGDYKHQCLATAALKFETAKREQNLAYGGAISSYVEQGASLKIGVGTATYADLAYSNLRALARELLSRERREFAFARQRAKDRAIARMAREMGGADPEAAYKRHLHSGKVVGAARVELQDRVKTMLDRKGEGRTWTRVVFFGNAQFGHGSAGPLPRKRLLWVLAAICVVVLTDEFRTTVRCCGCGEVLKQQNGSRIYGCPTVLDEDHCSIRFIDRDDNASVNIAMCGVHMLLGLPRPIHLQRERPPVAVDGVVEE
ncbi:hypothetical protein JKP88DRAFT_157003 [Tribonema minus]|uniref:Transposase n=1 Tax=Tribonema minus TaxID=303371 RepID=A0A835Z611_9STRA|nr:hypothetical protein JKP88DRAFT_157003 [Tribonema minus]